jgi:cellulose synthase/poly-beta-1,6-N-acetylglucosamine synthase-like glycosyltransferase
MLFDLLAYLMLAIMFIGMVAYPKLTYFLARGKKLPVSNRVPPVTIIIPVHNGENLITEKIENVLAINYPKDNYEIIVVDNESTDGTAAIAKKYPVKVLRSAKGKVKALNVGLSESRFDTVVITDVDTIIDADSIRVMASHLVDNVGVVQGYVVPPDKFFIRGKKEYRVEDWDLRRAEGEVDSACNSDGKFLMFRKDLIRVFPENILAEDYYLALFMRRHGYRVVLDKDARVFERSPLSAKEELWQFRRYCRDVMVNNFRNMDMLFNPKYGYYGMFTMPFRRFFPMLYPLFLFYLLAYAFWVNYYLALAFILALFLLYRRKEVMFMLLAAVFLAYFDLPSKEGYGGKWKQSWR